MELNIRIKAKKELSEFDYVKLKGEVELCLLNKIKSRFVNEVLIVEEDLGDFLAGVNLYRFMNMSQSEIYTGKEVEINIPVHFISKRKIKLTKEEEINRVKMKLNLVVAKILNKNGFNTVYNDGGIYSLELSSFSLTLKEIAKGTLKEEPSRFVKSKEGDGGTIIWQDGSRNMV